MIIGVYESAKSTSPAPRMPQFGRLSILSQGQPGGRFFATELGHSSACAGAAPIASARPRPRVASLRTATVYAPSTTARAKRLGTIDPAFAREIQLRAGNGRRDVDATLSGAARSKSDVG